MSEHQESNVGKTVWQSQTLDAPPISLAFVHHQVAKLNAEFRRERLLLYWVVGLGVVALLVALLKPVPEAAVALTYVNRVGVVLAFLGFAYVTIQARRRGSQVTTHPGESVARSLEAYRTELQRRRDYYAGSWRWSVLPLLPTALVYLGGGALFDPKPNTLLRYGLLGLFVVTFTLLGILDYKRKARTFQRELDAIDTLYRPVNQPDPPRGA